MTTGRETIERRARLIALAKSVREKAYSPYSGFAVGAAVETSQGRVFCGCNIENASYGLSNCAERTAIFNAVSAGCTDLVRLAVIADTPDVVTPCGACRQVMREFGVQEIILSNLKGSSKAVTLSELLPLSFGPEQMEGDRRNA